MKNRVCLAAAVFTVLLTTQVFAGEWKRDSVGVWYQKDDGSYAVGWFQAEDGSRYYFDENGYAKTGWMKEDGKDYYFLPGSGKLAAGYATVLDRKLYYFDENGVSRKMADKYVGWLKDEANWYYQTANGTIMRNDWAKIDDIWYHFDESGYMQTGPLVVDGVQYYLEDNGAMVVNTKKEIDGVYYEFDGSGAGTVTKAPVVETETPQETLSYTNPAVPPEDQKSEHHKAADAMADQILARIVNDSMTKRQKAEAIYAWVRGNFRYSGSSATRDWGEEAYQGFRKRRGDCFTYFSTSHLLLTRCGIESMMILRSTDNHHYWNLVLVEEGWYHFDTCPRSAGGYFCLWTDAQMAAYSKKHGNCFAFDHSLYPQIQ